MTDNFNASPPEGKKPKLPIIALSLIGMALAGYCIFGILVLLKPGQFTAPAEASPSPTATLTREAIASPTPERPTQALSTDSASQWPILVSDSFDSNQNIWNTESVSNEDYSYAFNIKEGKYVWSLTSKMGAFIRTYAGVAPVSNFYLSAELKLTKGTYKPDYGLVFRENPVGDFYYFGIYGEGFVVNIYNNQAWSEIIEYTKSSAILPQEANLLTVIAEESHFMFFINNQFVSEITDDRIKEGNAGFGVGFPKGDLQNTFEFDNFILRVP